MEWQKKEADFEVLECKRGFFFFFFFFAKFVFGLYLLSYDEPVDIC